MRTVIGILTKATFPEWRFGLEEQQDWYKQCVLGVRLAQELEAEIVTSSEFTSVSGVNDEQVYANVIESLGAHITLLGKGLETTEQMVVMKKYADEKKARLVLVVTFLHFLRVLWLCRRRGIEATLKVSWGIPRPQEAVTDVLLTFLFPLLDLLGLEERVFRGLRVRRKAEKL